MKAQYNTCSHWISIVSSLKVAYVVEQADLFLKWLETPWKSLFGNRSKMSHITRKLSGFLTRVDTNQAVQPQKMARGLKFVI